METERIALSQRERDRLHVLHDAQQGRLTQVAAAQRMKLSERQVRRLLQRLREEGDRVVIHGLRGRPSNRKLDVSFERKVLTRVGQRYADFGPTLAAEHLAQDGLPLSRETLRKWMTKAAFWRPRCQEVCAGLRGAAVEIERRLDGSHWLRYRGRYLHLHPCPESVRPSASPSALRPPGLAEQKPRTQNKIKPKYHVPADHPWRKPWKPTFLSC